ncbi:hypothetical protein ACFV9E_03260 [Streptomyces sp. NPDC059835]|uniref:hypothetical protein n=1 Tax=unclassified Streptomyces TaxID=2593676 RepID=UPI00364A8328
MPDTFRRKPTRNGQRPLRIPVLTNRGEERYEPHIVEMVWLRDDTRFGGYARPNQPVKIHAAACNAEVYEVTEYVGQDRFEVVQLATNGNRKWIGSTSTRARTIHLIQRFDVFGPHDFWELLDRPGISEAIDAGIDIVLAEAPAFAKSDYSHGAYMVNFINDEDPCAGVYSYYVDDRDYLLSAVAEFCHNNEMDPLDWRIESVEHHWTLPDVSYCFNDIRDPDNQRTLNSAWPEHS